MISPHLTINNPSYPHFCCIIMISGVGTAVP